MKFPRKYKNTDSILIAGDSWGRGEWSVFSNSRCGVSHRGLEQYFWDAGKFVVNVSNGGQSNSETICFLKDALANAGSTNFYTEKVSYKFDYVFWIQSNPLRDIYDFGDEKMREQGPNFGLKEFLNQISTSSEFLQKQNDLLNETYKELNSLGIKIYCMGGVSKLNTTLLHNYKNLKVLIPSIAEFLIPEYKHPDMIVEGINLTKMIGELPINGKEELLDFIIDNKKKIEYLFYLDNPGVCTFFSKDHIHPDRNAHKVLFDYICRELKIKIS